MTCFNTRTNIGTFSGRPQPSCASGAIAWWGRTSSRRGTCCQRLPGRTWGEQLEIGSLIALISFQYLEKVRSVDVMIKNQQQFFHHAGCHWRAGSKAKPQTCGCRLHGLEGFSLQRVRFPRTRHLSRGRSLNNLLIISALGTCLGIDLSKSLFWTTYSAYQQCFWVNIFVEQEHDTWCPAGSLTQ